jgi:YegS/Rv2252/BmrU family lipid kinase
MAERFFVILNPTCGRGQGERLLPRVRAALDQHRLDYRLYCTARAGEAIEVAVKASRDFSVIVAAGGDGTVNEVANGVMGSEAAVGVIPIGSGNDFAKSLSVPPDLSKAVAILQKAQRRRVDLARLVERLGDLPTRIDSQCRTDVAGKSPIFTNGLGIGLDGAVSHRNRVIKHLKGELAYLWAAVREALAFRALPLELRTPDWSYTGTVLLAGASNGRFQGGDFMLAPQAEVDDGLLDVHLITDMQPLRRLMQIPKVRRGEHLSLPEVTILKAPWLELSSSVRLPAHLDGEPLFLEPGRVRVEVLPGGLEVISA